MNAFNFPIPKMTLGLIIGILVSENINIVWPALLGFLAIVILAMKLLWHRGSFKLIPWTGLATALLVVSLGVTIVKIQKPGFKKQHYSHSKDTKEQRPLKMALQITAVLKPSPFNQRFYANIIQLESRAVNGKILLNIANDPLKKSIYVDDVLLLFSKLDPISGPKNPHAFDYKKYLSRKRITHQVKSKPIAIRVLKAPKRTLLGWSYQLKTTLADKINQMQLTPSTKGFLKAFYLGDRNEIPERIKTNYKRAGVLHILALSGLHVGIFLMLLKFLFRPLLQHKKGKQIRSLLMVLCLWAFAILSGLSPSIVRAVSMFSLFAIAQGLNRQTNSINTLFISAFILLLINPNYCFDVGFQLSYLAVLGILIIKPKLDGIWTSKNKIIEFFNATLKVSLAAQIGIFPLLLYYFHQFPGLFLLANLLVLPLLIVSLYLGVFILALGVLDRSSQYLNVAFEELLNLMNTYVNWISKHEFFIFTNVPFDFFMLCSTYILLYLAWRFYNKKNYKNSLLLLMGITIFQSYKIQQLCFNPKKEFIVFYQIKKTVLGFRDGSYFQLHQKDAIKPTFLENYTSREGLINVSIQPLKKIYSIGNHKLLIVDSTAIYGFKNTPIDWVLLSNSPKLNLDDLIENLRPKYIIADGSNYTTYVERWKKTCLKYKIRFHDTALKGAFVFNIEPQGVKLGTKDF